MMADEIIVIQGSTDKENYEQLIPQINSLINPDEPIISSLSNVTAALKSAFKKISWVGFYLLKDETLYLGPFQGKVACTQIKIGSGVCGTSAQTRETIIVEDVDKFPGHIACDSKSKSEIVIPLSRDNVLWGVLDLDSYSYSSFNAIDAKYLNELVKVLVQKLDFTKIKI